VVRAAGLLLPAAGGFGVLAFVLWLASPVAAAPPPSGNWSVTGAEAYLDQTITLLNVTDLSGNATEYGNLTVASSGDLTFDNVTLVLPFRAALDIQGRAVFRNSTVVGETWKLWLRGTVEFTDDTFVNATFGSIAVETSALVLERNLWNCSAGGGTIAVRRALDFRNQTLQAGCGLSYELPILTVNKDIEIANLSIRNTGSANGIQFNGALHTGRVRFDLHDLTLNGSGGWPLYVQAASPSTSYAIHDSAFSESGVAGIRCDSFDGGFAIWNMTFTNVLRAFRMDGLPSGQVVATADNVTVVGTTDSILANDITWVIRNSTIQGASPQFDAGTNGHIRIYDSVATAFAANYPSTGGSIEHFTWLAMGVPTWQGAVAITDDAVTLLDGNGLASIQVNASTWAPQEIVWWGMYPGSSRIDNRQLQPTVRDGGTAFNCTPSSFLVSPGMATVDVTCMDDAPPSFTVFSPTLPRIQNNSLLAGTARVDEAGSGLNTVEFSLDGLNYGPVAFAPGDTHNFSFSRAGMADGTYGIWLRARDRTANERVVTLGPLTLDTVDPALALDPRPPIVSGFAATISGTTEPNTSITVARVGGFTNSTTSTANGSFAVGVLLEEGQNAYTVTARDAAGNSYALVATTFVDTRAPSLSVSLDGKPDTAAVTRTATVRVAGNAEAGSTVRVSGALADRSGEGFSYDLALVRGLNLLNVTATDAAGNTATWYGLAYFDDVAPTVTISVDGEARTSGSTVITRSSTVGLSGVALDNETGIASLIVNGTAIAVAGSGDFSTALPVGEGENRVVVTASDSVGNTASFRFTVVRDTAAPGATASAAADASPSNRASSSVGSRSPDSIAAISSRSSNETPVTRRWRRDTSYATASETVFVPWRARMSAGARRSDLVAFGSNSKMAGRICPARTTVASSPFLRRAIRDRKSNSAPSPNRSRHVARSASSRRPSSVGRRNVCDGAFQTSASSLDRVRESSSRRPVSSRSSARSFPLSSGWPAKRRPSSLTRCVTARNCAATDSICSFVGRSTVRTRPAPPSSPTSVGAAAGSRRCTRALRISKALRASIQPPPLAKSSVTPHVSGSVAGSTTTTARIPSRSTRTNGSARHAFARTSTIHARRSAAPAGTPHRRPVSAATASSA